jgi:hypothetical protein
MAATTITVTGTYLNADGTACAGTVTFTLSEPITNSGVIYHQAPQVATLNGSGAISQILVANDDTGTTPTGSFYTVSEVLSGAPSREYSITAPHTAVGSTIDLSTLMPNTAPGIGGS